MTLNYMSSVWIAAFLVGGSLMGTLSGHGHDMRRQGPLVLAVLTGFMGVVMMLRPTIEQNQLFAGLVGLISGPSHWVFQCSVGSACQTNGSNR
jgi:S-adenosylmethionine uptake transporter